MKSNTLNRLPLPIQKVRQEHHLPNRLLAARKNNILNYQAGAGIVIDSDPEKELEEVKNKLGALDKALNDAELIK